MRSNFLPQIVEALLKARAHSLTFRIPKIALTKSFLAKSFLTESASDVVFRLFVGGLGKDFFRLVDSIILPRRKNPVNSATRAACCML